MEKRDPLLTLATANLMVLILIGDISDLYNKDSNDIKENLSRVHSIVCPVAVWGASAVYLLDWNERWQGWPVPTIMAAVAGSTVRSLLAGIPSFD